MNKLIERGRATKSKARETMSRTVYKIKDRALYTIVNDHPKCNPMQIINNLKNIFKTKSSTKVYYT